ncbi:GNAT family N-acetyltransferase [uncultured Anaerococcus sp.]|uniref:GNAT family N-acetyltransferase n=1 Tax=uncultured Anaerococcus sp. TaxID=293428 RepID=UPI00288B88B1|nr:GNAT family N-acetyltransferase [uncultured Anaerococcus sp.]
MRLIITNKAENLDLDKLMEVYKESNYENMISLSYDCLDDLESAYKEYLKKDFLENKDNYLAVLANGQSYLSALRLHRGDGGYLIEAIETKPEFRNLGYGLSLLFLVRKRIPEGFYLRSEVSEKNIKSLGLHKKLAFDEKEKIGNTIIFISKGQRKKKAK